MSYQAINFKDKFAKFDNHWSPRVIAEMNDYQFKLVKVEGEFVWHDHPDTDEVFIVLEGALDIEFEDGKVSLLAGEMFVDAAGVQVQHIPYKGMGPMMADIIGGQVEFGVAAVAAAQGHLASGRMKAIGVMGKERVASLPDVPTLAEQGFPDVDVAGWFAMIGPKGLPAAQVDRLHKAVVAAFNDPDVKATMAKQDNLINPTSPDAAARFLKSEQDRYARLVSKANIKLD